MLSTHAISSSHSQLTTDLCSQFLQECLNGNQLGAQIVILDFNAKIFVSSCSSSSVCASLNSSASSWTVLDLKEKRIGGTDKKQKCFWSKVDNDLPIKLLFLQEFSIGKTIFSNEACDLQECCFEFFFRSVMFKWMCCSSIIKILMDACIAWSVSWIFSYLLLPSVCMATTPNIRLPNCDDGLNTSSFELVEIRCIISLMVIKLFWKFYNINLYV